MSIYFNGLVPVYELCL